MNRLTRTSLTKDKDPEGMLPDRTIFSESFFFDKFGERRLFGTTEAAAIAQPFVAGIEEIAESHTSAQFRVVGVLILDPESSCTLDSSWENGVENKEASL